LITPFDELDFIPNVSDKIEIVEAYHKIEMRYRISEFPDIDKINEIFLDLSEITNLDFVIDLKKKNIVYTINTIPSVKYFPDMNNIKFDINEWDSIIQEIKPAIGRIEDLGYGVETFIKTHGNISLIISKI
jgi:hypothetical protein